ncbi:MAG TPA: EAL domain-containing protein [Candidatus Limnocylindria bacterium]|nr:EAL domain-containing protein [Candidatus Limnocylindria bacterium]
MPVIPMLWSRSAAVRHVYFEPSWQRRLVYVAAIVPASFFASIIAYPYFGSPSATFNLIAVMAVASLFGLRAGVPVAVAIAFLTSVELWALGDPRWPTILSPGLPPHLLAVTIVAIIAGRLHDVGAWLRREQIALQKAIDAKAAAEQAGADTEVRQRAILDNLPIIVLAVDLDGCITYHAGAGLNRVGSTPAEPGDSVYERYRTRPEHIEYFERARAGEGVHATIHWDDHEFTAHFAPARLADGSINGVVAIAYDETERRTAERTMQELRTHDALTGFSNRDTFVGGLDRRLQQERLPFAVAAIVIDNLREVNEGLGHQAGDEMLRTIGELLRAQRIVDLARIGGAEFAAVILGELDAATRVVSEIGTALEASVAVDGITVQAIAFTGLTNGTGHHSGASVLREATVAAEMARRGGTTYAVYTADKDHHRTGAVSLAAELHRAIDGDELSLEYQPIVEIASRRVIGVEALVRWNHPTRGLILPSDFIPLAERTGLIRPMTRWVIERALVDGRATLSSRDIELSVNLSMRNLQDEDLPATVYGLLRSGSGASPQLRLEVTESAVMADAHRAVSVLTRLREMGVRIAIDDFGTGYSSLAYLQRLPVDTLKIDRSFVRDVTRDPARRAIIRAVIEMARALNLHTVAEGVEDVDTWALLATLGAGSAQGYLIARPMNIGALCEWLASARWGSVR